MDSKTEKADEIFSARVQNMIAAATDKNYPKYSLFLDEHQQMLALGILKKHQCEHYHFYGGFKEAKRKMLCVYPDYLQIEDLSFPIRYLSFTYRKSDTLKHRDFLGSLMALQIKRETVGDIAVGEGLCSIAVGESTADYILNNVRKIGRVGVAVCETESPSIQVQQEFEEQSGTVASLRIDSVAALATKLSRSKTVQLIEAGKVAVNYQEISSASQMLKPGDVISVRGFGKYILGEEIRETKKGRYYIMMHKYI